MVSGNRPWQMETYEASCLTHRTAVRAYVSPNSKQYRLLCGECMELERKACLATEAAARRAEAVQRLRHVSGIPRRYLDVGASLKDCVPIPDALGNWIAKALEGKSAGPLLIVGPPSKGKTHMAAAIAAEWHERNILARYLDPVSYVADLRTTWSQTSNRKHHDIVNMYVDAPMLVIDDIEAGKKYEHAVIEELIARRYDLNTLRFSILISNLKPRDWGGVFAHRIVERIRERSTIHVAVGKDWRHASIDGER